MRFLIFHANILANNKMYLLNLLRYEEIMFKVRENVYSSINMLFAIEIKNRR